ncbi:MAG: hypothetical protein P8Y38_13480 [Deltaproteobacteria bacterium]|jgi:hypothetical protein
MSSNQNRLAVNVVVEMTSASLQAIVEHAKKLAGRNEKGHYQIDTADKVGEMISKFLREKDFEAYVEDPDNYT